MVNTWEMAVVEWVSGDVDGNRRGRQRWGRAS